MAATMAWRPEAAEDAEPGRAGGGAPGQAEDRRRPLRPRRRPRGLVRGRLSDLDGMDAPDGICVPGWDLVARIIPFNSNSLRCTSDRSFVQIWPIPVIAP